MKKSYLEQCIQSLPPEKQEAARQAYKELAESGDGGFLSKLLLVLEANGSYAERIPAALSTVLANGLSGMDARLSSWNDGLHKADENREKQIREILAEMLPAMARELSVEALTKSVEAQSMRLGKLEKGVSHFRHLRIGGILLLMLLALLAGGGTVAGIFWKDFEHGKQAASYLDFLSAHGIFTNARAVNGKVYVAVEGPGMAEGTDWRKGDDGSVIGADLVFPTR